MRLNRVNPVKTSGGICFKSKRGSFCGNPSAGKAKAARTASPTSVSHNKSGITTDMVLMFPLEDFTIGAAGRF